MENLDKLKKLSPEERIRKLKELKKQQEEEIKKAQDMMNASEAELEEKSKQKADIPIPQLRSVDVSSLFGKGTQEEEVFNTKRFRTRKVKEEKEESLEEEVKGEKDSLESQIIEERNRLKEGQKQTLLYQAQLDQQKRDYMANMAQYFSEGTSGELYVAVKDVYEQAKSSGYISSEQMTRVTAASEAALSKLDAMVSGDYLASKQVTDTLVASARMAKAMKDMYKA